MSDNRLYCIDQLIPPNPYRVGDIKYQSHFLYLPSGFWNDRIKLYVFEVVDVFEFHLINKILESEQENIGIKDFSKYFYRASRIATKTTIKSIHGLINSRWLNHKYQCCYTWFESYLIAFYTAILEDCMRFFPNSHFKLRLFFEDEREVCPPTLKLTHEIRETIRQFKREYQIVRKEYRNENPTS